MGKYDPVVATPNNYRCGPGRRGTIEPRAVTRYRGRVTRLENNSDLEIADEDIIPLYLDKDTKPESNYSHSGYVLMEVSDGHLGHIADNSYCYVTRRFDTQMIRAIRIYYGKYVIYYSKFDWIDKFNKSLALAIGGLLTGNMTNWYKTGNSSGYDDLRKLVSLEKIRKIEKFKYVYNIKNKINEKITQFHHLHVRLKDLYSNKEKITLYGFEAYLAMQLDRFSNVHAVHSTFMVYYHALPDRERDLFLLLLLSYDRIDRDWLKREGVMAKQSQHGTNYDLSKIFELNVLENRVSDLIDWDKEKKNRTVVKSVSISDDDVYRIAKRMFLDGRKQRKKPISMSWEDYWQQRSVIMPSGAVHSKYDVDNDIIKSLPRQLKNKKGFCSVMGDVTHDYWVDREPEIVSHVSTKYEWGKTRALYGCDISSHVNADFGLLSCEETFPNYALTGSSASTDNVYREMNSMIGIPLCYDYDDFNSQHSVGAMKNVLRAWQDVFSECLSMEQHRSISWTRDSIENMYVINNITADHYRANGTLFSGWRLTSFINTALNYVYLSKAGLDSLSYKSVHNGDDVFASVNNLGNALKIVKNAEDIGVRAQINKMNIGTIAEFLRMDIRSVNLTSTQYITRGCSTFTHSRVESESPLALRNVVSSYYMRYNELLSRGAKRNVIHRIYKKQLYYSAVLFDAPKEVIDALVTYDLAAGGVVKNGLLENKRLIELSKGVAQIEENDVKTIIHNGTSSYLTFLKRKFNTISEAFSYSAVLRNSVNMYNLQMTTCKIVDTNYLELVNERVLDGAWANLPGITTIHRIRMGVSNIVMAVDSVSSLLSSILRRSGDPQKWMRILL